MSQLRRTFLKAGGALVAAGPLARAAAPADCSLPMAKSPLPTVQFGKATITRLIMGGNPFGAYSHSTPKLDDLMRNYYTVQRTADQMFHAAEEGINTVQSHYSPLIAEALTRARDQGANLNWICLSHPGESAILKDILALKPIGIAHHGNRTDDSFHFGANYPPEKIHDFVKMIKDKGVFAGVSTHSPGVFGKIVELGWDNDFFMGCLYYLTRTPDELKGVYGDQLVAKEEPFVDGDPARMTERIRSTTKPCLAFKLLAAGRNCRSKEDMEKAYRFAYSHIKPGDACIVGMFPVMSDEVRENADLARKFAVVS